jgi:hypothetical protein
VKTLAAGGFKRVLLDRQMVGQPYTRWPRDESSPRGHVPGFSVFPASGQGLPLPPPFPTIWMGAQAWKATPPVVVPVTQS